MAQEPIILAGGAQMITIQLPLSFKRDAEKTEGKFSIFSISPEPNTEILQSIVFTDTKTGCELFKLPLDDENTWMIEIK
ncbi:MAG: hypothetical protein QOD00_3333 [Blastocatellia bacterium]|jgi:hypothetical protein|nr:hypothetical protein [Blastocatellia bacterium]